MCVKRHPLGPFLLLLLIRIPHSFAYSDEQEINVPRGLFQLKTPWQQVPPLTVYLGQQEEEDMVEVRKEERKERDRNFLVRKKRREGLEWVDQPAQLCRTQPCRRA